MKLSIRVKITFMVVLFSIFVVAMSWVICNYIIGGVFVSNLKSSMVSTYDSCNSFFSETNADEEYNGDLYGKIKNTAGAIILVIDAENGKIYTSINDQGQMIESLRGIIRVMNDSDDRFVYKPGSYSIKRNHDVAMGADYYDLIGVLNNGYSVIIRCPISQINTTTALVSKVFTTISIGLVVFGSLFMLIFSNIFASPIKKLCNSAKRMTQLDFDAKVDVRTRDEIGELGNCMNEMSEKLEETISELKAANLRLQQDIVKKTEIDEMRKEFLSHVSHELKTPIALVQGYAEGLKDSIFDDKENQDFYCDVIIDEAHKMNTMVKKLLDLNEIEFGDTPINVQRFELVDFLQNILNASGILIEESGARLVFEEKPPIYVWADEYMIEEVFTNYLTNAIHYVTEGGEIRITCETHDNNIRVSVFNEGSQIGDEDIDKVFIKFYKADKARTREYGGSGIGLSIVAATMEAHNKPYGVYNVDNGVVFYFELDANMPC